MLYSPRMNCSHCGESQSKVVDSRPAEQGEAIRRRRECEACGERYTTYERREAPTLVRKRDGTLQLFTPDKIRNGLARALAGSAVTTEEMSVAVADIETQVRAMGDEVTSDDIGLQVLGYLRAVDEAAYIRFASVYKDFKDASDFEREAASLETAAVETASLETGVLETGE